MRTKNIICYTLAALLVGGGLIASLTGCASEGCGKGHQHGDLAAQAKVSRADAEKAALAKVPGIVQKGEFEKWKGKFYWSFDIATEGAKKATEVAVDPNTGAVVWTSADKQAKKLDKLAAEAKVSRADAEAAALAKVPGGTIKDGELEKENGKLIWSFDITTSDSKDITEVAVCAMSGKVMSVDKESPADQAKEAAEDAAKAKKEKGEEKD
jgi:uncharacterized membrane protein YkoI